MTSDPDKNTLLLESRLMLPVRLDGDPVLRRKAKPIPAVTADLRLFGEQMLVSMLANNGVGLAAPQVGKSIRMITLNTGMSVQLDTRSRGPSAIASTA